MIKKNRCGYPRVQFFLFLGLLVLHSYMPTIREPPNQITCTNRVLGMKRKRVTGGALASAGAGIGLFGIVRSALKSPAIRGILKNVILGRGRATRKKKRKRGGRFSSHTHGARGSGVNIGIKTGRGLNPAGTGLNPAGTGAAGLQSIGFGARQGTRDTTTSIADTISAATLPSTATRTTPTVADTGGGGAGQFFMGNVSNSRSGPARRIHTLLPSPAPRPSPFSGTGLRRAGEGLRRAGEGALGAGQKNILKAFI